MSLKTICVLQALLCLLTDSAIAASVFYADDGFDHTVAYPFLRNSERQDFQREILRLFGLERPPHPNKHFYDGHNNILPDYMLDLYRDSTDNEQCVSSADFKGHFGVYDYDSSISEIGFDLFDWSDADTIMSFPNHPKADEQPNHFRFDVSEVQSALKLIGAQLRLFRNSTHLGSSTAGSDIHLNMFIVRDENAEQLDLITKVTVDRHVNGWVVLNASALLHYWTLHPEKNRGLQIMIVDNKGRHLPVEQFGLIDCFLVGYFKTDNEVNLRRAKRSPMLPDVTYNDMDWSSVIGIDTKWTRSVCQRRTLYVSFRDLGWQDWIIAPDGYAAYYCFGECSFPLNAHMNATNHAIVQTLVHLMNPGRVPKPLCAPTKLSSISVLYFDDHSNVVLKKYNNMVVKSCGCH